MIYYYHYYLLFSQISILTKTAENAKGTGLQQNNVISETFIMIHDEYD
jgi:hypothetical protein